MNAWNGWDFVRVYRAGLGKIVWVSLAEFELQVRRGLLMLDQCWHRFIKDATDVGYVIRSIQDCRKMIVFGQVHC